MGWVSHALMLAECKKKNECQIHRNNLALRNRYIKGDEMGGNEMERVL